MQTVLASTVFIASPRLPPDSLPFRSAADLLPEHIRENALEVRSERQAHAEEFRLRLGFPAAVSADGAEYPFSEKEVSRDDLARLMELCTRSSLHTVLSSLSAGFVTAVGGHRLGICGVAGYRDGVPTFRSFTSAVLRIARSVPGCAHPVIAALTFEGSRPFPGTLIVSPPGGGKTTLVRDIVRELSDSGIRVGIADERGELAGQGVLGAAFDVGRHTDVLTGIGKAHALEMLIRTMSPQVAAMDEVTSASDVEALEHAAGCGVTLLATVHGSCLSDIEARPALHQLTSRGAFRAVVFISGRGFERKYRVEWI